MSWGPPDQGSDRPASDPWGSQSPQGPGPGGQQPGQWGGQPPQPGQWQQPPVQPGQWQPPPQPPQPGQWQQPPVQPGQWGGQPPQPPYGQPWGPPPDQAGPWWGGAPPALGDAYPVNVSFERRARINRLWGIPIVGYVLRALALIPHIIVLYLVALVVGILSLFLWIGVLINGRFPRIGYRWVGGYLRWTTRMGAWMWLLSGTYPPFSLTTEDHPIRVRIEEGQPINRFWGIPILGYLVRFIIVIPHLIVLWALGIVAAVLIMFAWVPVLLLGRQAGLVYTLVGGYLRWGVRVMAYLALLCDRYPPFSLGEDDPAPVW